MLTPFKDRGNLTRRQLNYNVKLAKNRYIIEHCFGVLKQKFRQLFHVKLRHILYIVHLIRAACVLHNISLEDNIDIEPNNVEYNEEDMHNLEINNDDDGDDEDEDIDARVVRQTIANSLQM